MAFLIKTTKPKPNKSINNLPYKRSVGSKIPRKEFQYKTKLLDQDILQRALEKYLKMCCSTQDTPKVNSSEDYDNSYWTTMIIRILE